MTVEDLLLFASFNRWTEEKRVTKWMNMSWNANKINQSINLFER